MRMTQARDDAGKPATGRLHHVRRAGGMEATRRGDAGNESAYSEHSARLADALKRDLDKLSKLGVKLDKAAAVARPAALATGIVAALRAYPILGAVIAIAGSVARSYTDEIKQAEFEGIRQKWWRRLSAMGPAQLADFANALHAKYPLAYPTARKLLE